MTIIVHTPPSTSGTEPLEGWASVSEGPLHISHHILGARVACLVARGELDAGTSAALERAVLASWAEGAELILLDVRPLEFVDVAGLRLLDQLDADSTVPTVVVETGPVVERLRRVLARLSHPSHSGSPPVLGPAGRREDPRRAVQS